MNGIERMLEGKEKEAAQNIVKCLHGFDYSAAMYVLDIAGKSLGNYATANARTDIEDSQSTL